MFKTTNPIPIWVNLFLLFLSLLLSLIILSLFKFLPLQLPLFYSLPWGEEQLATHQQFLIVPSVITLITLLNLSFSWQLHPSQIFFKKILLFSSLVISLILIITFIKIVLIFV